MKLSSGALVRCGNFADQIYVVRCPAGRPGYFHLQSKINGRATYTTRIAKDSELRLVRPAPTFKIGETVSLNGRRATVIEYNGDEVAIAIGISRVDAAKSDLVLERL
jgi:hypothetical protein